MGVVRVEDLRAFQLARAFKLEVYRLIRESDEARDDFRFRQQLSDAASGGESNIAEGFARWRATEISRFLTYAISSLQEALCRVQDGVDRGYFDGAACRKAFDLGPSAIRCTVAFWKSQQPFVQDLLRNRNRTPNPRPTRLSRSSSPDTQRPDPGKRSTEPQREDRGPEDRGPEDREPEDRGPED